MTDLTEEQRIEQAEAHKAEANQKFKGAPSRLIERRKRHVHGAVGSPPQRVPRRGGFFLRRAQRAAAAGALLLHKQQHPTTPHTTHHAPTNPAEKHYAAAVVGYTQAIELRPSHAIYWANRAAAHIRLEEYGSALADATAAIEADPDYIKGYYRRGDAYFALGKVKDALKDLRTAAKRAPRDPDLRRKLAECEKAVKRLRFEEALATPESEITHVSDTIDLSAMAVDDAYKGPRMQGAPRCVFMFGRVYAGRPLPAAAFAARVPKTARRPRAAPNRRQPPPNDQQKKLVAATMTTEDGEGGYVLTRDFVVAMMDEFRAQRLIHKRFAFQILLEVCGGGGFKGARVAR